MRLAVIDVETTGGSAKRERIIEFAVVIVENNEIVEQYETLINPERSIPPYITNMTGITNEMVSDAPKFYEVAKKIIELTSNCIFVAHNVRFDYGFVSEEYFNLGYTYSRKQLCTVKLFRKLFPGLRSYSLGNLINEFSIEVDSRHRAMADAKATFEIMQLGLSNPDSHLIMNNLLGETVKNTKFPPTLSNEFIENLPEKTGIYYFFNKYDEIIYIGKSINIKKRIKQHFQKINPKSNDLYSQTHRVDYYLTGSELIASIYEAEEIKRKKPGINKALKRSDSRFFVTPFQNDQGYISFKVKKAVVNDNTAIGHFNSSHSAKRFIDYLVEELHLCRKIAGLETYGNECLSYRSGNCNGACVGLESPIDYNERILNYFDDMKIFEQENFAIVDEGRSYDEVSIVLIENNKLSGYGFFNTKDIVINSLENVRDIINVKKYDKDFNTIIRRYMVENSGSYKIIV